ncbi:MAG: hypothetical protein NWP87_05360, partial [Winogradskyella sp.]|nr:hypothetical protein [Winogradskyella sp.]
MTAKFRILLLIPFLMAFQCEEDEIPCGVEFANNYTVNVENINETYASSETIWFNGEVSSELDNSCNNNRPEVVFDSTIFVTGFFVLKLTNEFVNLNAEVVQDFNVTYSTGEELSRNFCVEFVYFTPELSEDNLSYNYRVGISIDEQGDYCIVPAFSDNFGMLQQNNNQIFAPYDKLDDNIKFTSCGATYT